MLSNELVTSCLPLYGLEEAPWISSELNFERMLEAQKEARVFLVQFEKERNLMIKESYYTEQSYTHHCY